MNDERTIEIPYAEAKRLYALLEALQRQLHQPLAYENPAQMAKFAEANYPELHEMFYRVVWGWFPKDLQDEILGEDA